MKTTSLLVPFLLAASLPSAFAETTPEFAPKTVIPKAFPAITDPEIRKVSEVDEALVTDDELVIGVTVNGESRAYPVNMLTGPRREIINDALGGQSIAATW